MVRANLDRYRRAVEELRDAVRAVKAISIEEDRKSAEERLAAAERRCDEARIALFGARSD